MIVASFPLYLTYTFDPIMFDKVEEMGLRQKMEKRKEAGRGTENQSVEISY